MGSSEVGEGARNPRGILFLHQLPRAWTEARLPASWGLGMSPRIKEAAAGSHPGGEVLTAASARPCGNQRKGMAVARALRVDN